MDDLGAHDLGMHRTGIKTDCADWLAENGVYLENYYVLPSCSPTRSAIMTGRYPLHTGIHNWILSDSTVGLPLDEETLPQVLKRGANYTCHAVGKWHLGHARWKQTPTYRGFDSFFGFYVGGQDYFSHTDEFGGYDMRSDDKPNCGPGCSRIVDERGNYSTHVFTREAVHVLDEYASTRRSQSKGNPGEDDNNNNDDEEKDQPLFLYLAYQAVHAPDEVPESYRKPYEKQHPTWSEKRKTYAGMLTAADESIAAVIERLKQHVMWNDTLVVFTTDNGGPTETCAVQGSSNFPRRGGKCTVWEGGTTGDGLVAGPALERFQIPTGTRQQGLFHAVDWLPTLADMVGATPKGKPLDGVNQLGALQGIEAARNEVFVGIGIDLDWTVYGPAIRHDRWKLIEKSGGPSAINDNNTDTNNDNGRDTGKSTSSDASSPSTNYLLFDLSVDREEAHNVADKHPEILQLMKDKLEGYKKEMVPIPSEDPDCPFHGLVNTTIGKTWVPWCPDEATELLVYW